MAALHIHLLGDFRLTLGNEPLTPVHHARQQALLAYLLLHRNAPQPRQHLAFLFWPDTGEAQALTNLRNLLFKLRQALPGYAQSTSMQFPQVDDPRILVLVPELAEFAQAIRERRPPACTVSDGRRVLRVLDAMTLSDRTGAPVWVG